MTVIVLAVVASMSFSTAALAQSWTGQPDRRDLRTVIDHAWTDTDFTGLVLAGTAKKYSALYESCWSRPLRVVPRVGKRPVQSRDDCFRTLAYDYFVEVAVAKASTLKKRVCTIQSALGIVAFDRQCLEGLAINYIDDWRTDRQLQRELATRRAYFRQHPEAGFKAKYQPPPPDTGLAEISGIVSPTTAAAALGAAGSVQQAVKDIRDYKGREKEAIDELDAAIESQNQTERGTAGSSASKEGPKAGPNKSGSERDPGGRIR